jgi:hypothetical protein
LRHSQYFHSVSLDRTTIPQSLLNIENKTRSNPLKWNGQFSPQLVEVILRHYSQKNFTVFDPFLGSGTVLLEAGLLGQTAFGTEVNPAAYLLAKTYSFINSSNSDRTACIQSVYQLLEKYFGLTLFSASVDDTNAIKVKLLEVLENTSTTMQATLVKTLIVLLDFNKRDLTEEKIFATWRKLQQHILGLPNSERIIDALHADARSTPIATNSVDLVVTSPPYINVFNYHQQYRASLEHLNYNLLNVAKSEIGSNRKHRSNRFLTVIQYCLDMADVFAELLRICQTNSNIIFVVGRESTIRGTTFFNGEIVTEIAHHVFDLELQSRQERCFKNRFGVEIYEDLLRFSSKKSDTHTTLFAEKAQRVADLVLRSAYDYASSNIRDDIQAALQKLGEVTPSPLIDSAEVKDYV